MSETALDSIPIRDIIGKAEIRAMCGIKSRATFIAWRRDLGFPAPVKVLEAGELWDARAVRAWLKQQKGAA